MLHRTSFVARRDVTRHTTHVTRHTSQFIFYRAALPTHKNAETPSAVPLRAAARPRTAQERRSAHCSPCSARHLHAFRLERNQLSQPNAGAVQRRFGPPNYARRICGNGGGYRETFHCTNVPLYPPGSEALPASHISAAFK